MDLSGKLIIKAQLGDEIRCIPIHNEDITYDELMIMMQRVFRAKISSVDDVTLKYRDDDDDYITILDDTDLSFAVNCSKVLRLKIIVNGNSHANCEYGTNVANIRHELQSIRDSVSKLLDGLDCMGKHTGASEVPENYTQSTAPQLASNSKEFDPLSNKSNVGAKSNVVNYEANSERARAATPDSISSTGSYSSQRIQQQSSPSRSASSAPGIPPSNALPVVAQSSNHPGQPPHSNSQMSFPGVSQTPSGMPVSRPQTNSAPGQPELGQQATSGEIHHPSQQSTPGQPQPHQRHQPIPSNGQQQPAPGQPQSMPSVGQAQPIPNAGQPIPGQQQVPGQPPSMGRLAQPLLEQSLSAQAPLSMVGHSYPVASGQMSTGQASISGTNQPQQYGPYTATGANSSGYGQQQYAQEYQYNQPGRIMEQQSGGPPKSGTPQPSGISVVPPQAPPNAGANPFARSGPTYGQYPRAQGNYPPGYQ